MEKRHPMKENHFMKEKHSMKKYNRKNLKAIQTIVQENVNYPKYTTSSFGFATGSICIR